MSDRWSWDLFEIRTLVGNLADDQRVTIPVGPLRALLEGVFEHQGCQEAEDQAVNEAHEAGEINAYRTLHQAFERMRAVLDLNLDGFGALFKED